jgi:hypothetical protein
VQMPSRHRWKSSCRTRTSEGDLLLWALDSLAAIHGRAFIPRSWMCSSALSGNGAGRAEVNPSLKPATAGTNPRSTYACNHSIRLPGRQHLMTNAAPTCCIGRGLGARYRAFIKASAGRFQA